MGDVQGTNQQEEEEEAEISRLLVRCTGRAPKALDPTLPLDPSFLTNVCFLSTSVACAVSLSARCDP